MDADQTTRDAVRRYTEQGLRPREIALLLGVTTQNVYYHLARLREAGELPKEVAS